MKNIKTNLLIFSALTLAVFGFLTYSRAVGNEITACVKKDGTVHFVGEGFKRTDCKKNESLISWNKQGPKGQNASQLHLLDGNGQDLGVVLDTRDKSSIYTTYIPDIGIVADFTQPNSIHGTVVTLGGYVSDVFFKTTDCSGNAYWHRASRYPTGFVNGGSDFYKFKKSTVVNTILLSMKTSGNDICKPFNENATSTTAVPLEQITLPFTQPLIFPLEVEQL